MKYGVWVPLALAVSACSSDTVRDTLGLSRAAPDEFRVISRPPLSVPPQFSLRPPAASDLPPGQLPADQRAQSLLGGADTAVKPVEVITPGGRSAGESQLLQNAGAGSADPKVRDAMVEERYQAEDKKASGSWWDLFSSEPEKKEPVVDAKKESDRLKQNQAEGKPVTEGTTPEAQGRDTGVLGRILGY